MLILWIRKNKADNLNHVEKKDAQTLQKHDDIIKQFRLAHPDIAMAITRDIMTEDGNLLAPAQQVKLWENMQN